MKYDLVVPVAPKDYVKLPFCIKRCVKYLNPKPENVYIVAKQRIRIENSIYVNENEILPFNVNQVCYRRPQWIYQQIVKLCQNFTVNDFYLCVDSDLFFNKPVNMFEGDKPIYYRTIDQHHEPYFNLMKKLFNLEKQVDHTFIADFTMFNKNICREIIPDAVEFLRQVNEIISDECLIGEPEIYGNYLAKNYPDSYLVKTLIPYMQGRYLPNVYSYQEIEGLLKMAEQEWTEDLIILHSWT